jgi:hypothetical protein
MIKTSIENLAEPIGFDIGNSDDIVQSNLFNGIGRAFKSYNKDALSMQLCYISQKLKPETCEYITGLAEFIKLNNNK